MDIAKLLASEDRPQIERWARAHAQFAYLGKHRGLCRILGKLVCYVDTRDRSVAPWLMLDGYWELWITQAVARYVKPGMRCIDVGANFGYYTLLLGELVGPKGSVFAIEPNQDVPLQQSVELNGFGQVVVAYAAAGRARGLVRLTVPDGKLGDGHVIAPGREPDGDDYEVTTFPLDDLMGDKPYDFIKIDAEGSELEIWHGMQGVLRSNPVVLMEFHRAHLERQSPDAATELLDQIQKAGYVLKVVADDAAIRPIEREKLLSGGVQMLWLQH